MERAEGFEVWFCKDGFLRLKKVGVDKMYPLSYMNRKNQTAQFMIEEIFEEREYPCFFEEGLTVKSFLECLRPWQEYVSDYFHSRFSEWLDALENGLPGDPVPVEDDDRIDYIEISRQTLLENEVQVSKRGKKKVSGKWEFSSRLVMNGFCRGKEESYSLEHYPFEALLDTPMILSNRNQFIFADSEVEEAFGTPLINSSAKGVKTAQNHRGKLLKAIDLEEPLTVNDVLEAFFEEIAFTPKESKEMFIYLKGMVDQIKDLPHDDPSLISAELEDFEPPFESDFESPYEIGEVLFGLLEGVAKSSALKRQQAVSSSLAKKGESPEDRIERFLVKK